MPVVLLWWAVRNQPDFTDWYFIPDFELLAFCVLALNGKLPWPCARMRGKWRFVFAPVVHGIPAHTVYVTDDFPHERVGFGTTGPTTDKPDSKK